MNVALKWLLNFDWLSGFPTPAAKWIFLGLFIAIGVVVCLIPRDYIYEGLEHPRWYHNLKLWAIGALLTIFVTYAIF